MTLKQQVAEAIRAEYPGTLTNQQLAVRLGANEPSVRRITKELNRERTIVDWEGGYSNIPVGYRASMAEGRYL